MAATPLTNAGHALAVQLGQVLTFMGNAWVLLAMDQSGSTTVQAIHARLLVLNPAYSPANLSTLDRIATELTELTGCGGNIAFLSSAQADGPVLDGIVNDLVALEP
jgi:hypothetical protein